MKKFSNKQKLKKKPTIKKLKTKNKPFVSILDDAFYEPTKERVSLQRRIIKRFEGSFVRKGKRSVVNNLFNSSYDSLAQRFKKHPVHIVMTGMKKIAPSIEIITKKSGGTSYRIPVLLSESKSMLTATRWSVQNLKKRSGRTFREKLLKEIADNYLGRNNALLKKKYQLHKLGLLNRAFLTR